MAGLGTPGASFTAPLGWVETVSQWRAVCLCGRCFSVLGMLDSEGPCVASDLRGGPCVLPRSPSGVVSGCWISGITRPLAVIWLLGPALGPGASQWKLGGGGLGVWAALSWAQGGYRAQGYTGRTTPVRPSELPCGTALQAGKRRAAGWQAWPCQGRPVRIVPGRW